MQPLSAWVSVHWATCHFFMERERPMSMNYGIAWSFGNHDRRSVFWMGRDGLISWVGPRHVTFLPCGGLLHFVFISYSSSRQTKPAAVLSIF